MRSRRRQAAAWAVTMGAVPCPECGRNPAALVAPGRWERTVSWLKEGSATQPSLMCQLGHVWGGGATLRYGRLQRVPRWMRLPVELFRAVHRERSMVPVPLTYVGAAAVGVAVGIGVDLLFGWPWWLVGLGWLAAVWLVFFASALWGPGPPLRHTLAEVINPQRARVRELQRLEDALQMGRLTAYEVEGWQGSRVLGGWGGSREPETVTLRHGEPDGENPWLEVTTTSGGQPLHGALIRDETLRREWLREHAKPRFVDFDEPPSPSGDPLERARWRIERRRQIEDARLPLPEVKLMSVDGHAVAVDVIEVAGRWAGIAVSDDVVIEITAHGVAAGEVRLVLARTLEPFLDGLAKRSNRSSWSDSA